jgi:mannitol/fructose-specific phosphotransferase system IIA component (Ntr-type)
MSRSNQSNAQSEAIRLTSMLTRKTLRAKVAVAGWEEAADAVGALLVNSGKVTQDYVQAMKRVLEEMGPYAVIAPGIVLLHARPEDGVLEPCLGLVTLSIPVEFGHSENDPVDLVFALGAKDKQAHIAALQQLAQLLGEEDALSEIRSAKDGESLLHAIESRVS